MGRDIEVEALLREAEMYRAVGMLDRVEIVNDELRRRGEDPVIVESEKPRQTRQSAQATTRRKAARADG